MNSAHLHLISVHIPIVLIPFGALLLAFGLWRKSVSVTQVSFVTFIIATLAVLFAFNQGEGAEELIEDLAGISKKLIHRHEEAGELALWAAIILGVFSLGNLAAYLKNWSRAGSMALLTFVLAIITAGLLARAGQLGGMIRHPEAFPELKASNLSSSSDKVSKVKDHDEH